MLYECNFCSIIPEKEKVDLLSSGNYVNKNSVKFSHISIHGSDLCLFYVLQNYSIRMLVKF